jgi:hypothetical protein
MVMKRWLEAALDFLERYSAGAATRGFEAISAQNVAELQAYAKEAGEGDASLPHRLRMRLCCPSWVVLRCIMSWAASWPGSLPVILSLKNSQLCTAKGTLV